MKNEITSTAQDITSQADFRSNWNSKKFPISAKKIQYYVQCTNEFITNVAVIHVHRNCRLQTNDV